MASTLAMTELESIQAPRNAKDFVDFSQHHDLSFVC